MEESGWFDLGLELSGAFWSCRCTQSGCMKLCSMNKRSTWTKNFGNWKRMIGRTGWNKLVKSMSMTCVEPTWWKCFALSSRRKRWRKRRGSIGDSYPVLGTQMVRSASPDFKSLFNGNLNFLKLNMQLRWRLMICRMLDRRLTGVWMLLNFDRFHRWLMLSGHCELWREVRRQELMAWEPRFFRQIFLGLPWGSSRSMPKRLSGSSMCRSFLEDGYFLCLKEEVTPGQWATTEGSCLNRSWQDATQKHSKAWRRSLEDALEHVAEPGQWGGRSGRTCAGLHLQLKLWQSNAKILHRSHALIFIDIKAAFYSIAKQLVASEELQDKEFDVLCDTIQVPVTAREAFRKNLKETDAIKQSTGSELCKAMARASLKKAWFVIPDGNEVRSPSTGCRPGDPLADLFFTAVLSFALEEIHRRMAEEHLFTVDEAEVTNCSVAWVDDVAFSIEATADDLVNKTIAALSIIVDVVTEFGLSLSYGHGKTAVIMAFRGRNSTMAKRQHDICHKDGLPVFTEHHGMIRVPVVNHYKHLGGFLTTSGSTLQEIHVRGAQSGVKLHAVRKTLRNPRVEIKHKKGLVRALGVTVLTHHAGSWWNLTEGEYNAWQSAWTKMTQWVYPREPDGRVKHVTLQQRAIDLDCPMPMELLFLHRLRLVVQVLKDQDPYLIEGIIRNYEIAKGQSWLQGVFAAVTWLQEQIGVNLANRAVKDLHDRAMWSAIKESAHQLHKQIKKAEKAHLLRVRMYCELYNAEVEQSQLLKEMGWTYEGDTQDLEAAVEYQCTKCEKKFQTQASLAVHEQRKHGERVAVRRFLCDGICRACQKNFHTRGRAMMHLHSGQTGCWQKVFRCIVPMTLEQAAALDLEDRNKGIAVHQKGFRHWEAEMACRPCTQEEMQNGLQLKCQWHEVGEHDPTDEELACWSELGLLPPGQGGRDRTNRGPSAFKIENVVHGVQSLERRICTEVVRWTPHYDRVPPPIADNDKYILIFFSGHRRANDIADFVHRYSRYIPISIDTAVSETRGNMYDTDLWLRLIRSRRVVAGHGGPPCETFTMARWNQLLDEEGSCPQPLRTCDFPWGLPQLTYKEVQQCINGGCLFLRTIFLLMMIFAYGGATTLEHPRGPDDSQPLGWCVWDSGFVKRWMLGSHVALLTFLQGPLGREFSKPTRLLIGFMSDLPQRIFSAYDKSWRPSKVLSGRDAEGNWRTSQGKEYPSKLCEILALSYIAHADSLECEGHEDDPEGLSSAIEEMAWVWRDHRKSDQQMRKDFQPEWFN